MEKKTRKAIAKNLSLLNKTEESRVWHEQGFMNCRRAAYAAFAVAMKDKDISQDDIVEILQNVDDLLAFYTGEDELIDKALKETGIILDFHEVFSSDRIRKEEDHEPESDDGLADTDGEV